MTGAWPHYGTSAAPDTAVPLVLVFLLVLRLGPPSAGDPAGQAAARASAYTEPAPIPRSEQQARTFVDEMLEDHGTQHGCRVAAQGRRRARPDAPTRSVSRNSAGREQRPGGDRAAGRERRPRVRVTVRQRLTSTSGPPARRRVDAGESACPRCDHRVGDHGPARGDGRRDRSRRPLTSVQAPAQRKTRPLHGQRPHDRPSPSGSERRVFRQQPRGWTIVLHPGRYGQHSRAGGAIEPATTAVVLVLAPSLALVPFLARELEPLAFRVAVIPLLGSSPPRP